MCWICNVSSYLYQLTSKATHPLERKRKLTPIQSVSQVWQRVMVAGMSPTMLLRFLKKERSISARRMTRIKRRPRRFLSQLTNYQIENIRKFQTPSNMSPQFCGQQLSHEIVPLCHILTGYKGTQCTNSALVMADLYESLSLSEALSVHSS